MSGLNVRSSAGTPTRSLSRVAEAAAPSSTFSASAAPGLAPPVTTIACSPEVRAERSSSETPSSGRELAGQRVELLLGVGALGRPGLVEDRRDAAGQVVEAEVGDRVGRRAVVEGRAELRGAEVRRAHDDALQAGALGLGGQRRRDRGVLVVLEAELLELGRGGAGGADEGADVDVGLAEDVGRELADRVGEAVGAGEASCRRPPACASSAL